VQDNRNGVGEDDLKERLLALIAGTATARQAEYAPLPRWGSSYALRTVRGAEIEAKATVVAQSGSPKMV
jgi:hypothetical protein